MVDYGLAMRPLLLFRADHRRLKYLRPTTRDWPATPERSGGERADQNANFEKPYMFSRPSHSPRVGQQKMAGARLVHILPPSKA